MEIITSINDFLNNIVWGPVGLALLFGAGLIMTIRTKAFQMSHFAHWLRKTIGAIFTNKHVTAHTGKKDKSISQFQSLCTALAATIGTGNIVGVSTAIISGGPGAIFWMWVMAILGMMTNYSENVLGIFYRRKNADGEWSGGAMYYLEKGLGAKKHMKALGRVLAILFAVFCVIASFGIGNIAQVNSIAGNMDTAFGVPTWVTGIVLIFLIGLVVVGGLKRIASVTEKLVPFMAIAYIVLALVAVFWHIDQVPAAFASIFRCAFNFKAGVGGVAGFAVSQAITFGFKRGAFSNEAGLGSSVMVHSNSNVKEPVQQGMWGIFEVFADTIIVCTLTALIILTSGMVDLQTGVLLQDVKASSLIGTIFSDMFGTFFGASVAPVGAMFIAVAVLLFAYSTVLGWSHYGSKSMEYLTRNNRTIMTIYKMLFIVMSYFSATMELTLAWDLSDTFNGLMMIPNLIGVLALSGTVAAITKNYIDRTFHNRDLRPMYSAFEDVQAEQEKKD